MLEKKMPEIMNKVPVAFVTGMEMVPEKRVVGTIQKPFVIGEYLEAVHRLIGIGQLSAHRH